MTETTKMRVAVTLYRMYDTLVSRNTDICFISDYDDYMSQRDNEYIKKYLRNQHCLINKVSECSFFNSLSAEWKVDKGVLMSLLRQYNIYIKDFDTYNETLNKLRNKQIKHENVDKKQKHLSEAPKIFTSKHRCKYYINSLAEVYDLVKERYPFWDDIQNKIKYINERNVDLPKINMGINIKHRKGIVSKVSCRYSNCLVSMKAHETTKNGYTERELYCMKKGLNYSFDVNASIHRLTYMLNNDGKAFNGDVYEHIYKTAFPNGKWNDKVRADFKKMMMRNYFDTSAKNAAKNYINSVKKEKHYCPDIEKTSEIFERIYPALRAVEGPTFDNEIFLWESVIMINLIYRMMQNDPDLKVFSVYDGIYFNNPVNDVEAMWQEEAEQTCALLLASTQKAAATSLCSNISISKQQIPYLSANIVSLQTQYCSRVLQTMSIYTLTDNLAFFHSLANNNAQVLHHNDLARENFKLTLFSKGSSIEMVESRRKNAALGKGVKHNSENMKGVKHDKKTGVLAKIKALGLTNITDKKLFVAECEKLGIKRRTAYSWFELVNIE